MQVVCEDNIWRRYVFCQVVDVVYEFCLFDQGVNAVYMYCFNIAMLLILYSCVYSLGLLDDAVVDKRLTPLDTLSNYLSKRLAYGTENLLLG